MKKNYTTPHVCIPLNNPRRNIPSEHDQNASYRLQQSALDSFHADIHDSVSLSVGSEAKLDMYNNFDLGKLFDLHLGHLNLRTHHSAESSRKVRSL